MHMNTNGVGGGMDHISRRSTSCHSKAAINVKACCKTVFSETISYSTVRSAHIESKSVAIVYRLAQLGILTYIIGYDIILNKGYQTFDTVTSTVSTKVKGLGYLGDDSDSTSNYFNNLTNQPLNSNIFQKKTSNAEDAYNNFGRINGFRIFDTTDYVIPPNEYNSLFIMSNFIETIQTPGICDEAIDQRTAICENDTKCSEKQSLLNTWNGVPTGRCIQSTQNSKYNVCEIVAWCPVELDNLTEKNMIKNVLNFTIFIKNDIEFKRFNKKERNIQPGLDNKKLSECRYNSKTDPYCPIFTVGDILKTIEPTEKGIKEMLKKGAIIEIGYIWNCNYDVLRKNCVPQIYFQKFSSGFNFRFSSKYMINGSEYRTLYKAFGLRFIISVSGIAGKFSILKLMITIGAGLGLMSISVLVADCVLLNFTQKKKLFHKLKELDAKEALENPEVLENNLL